MPSKYWIDDTARAEDTTLAWCTARLDWPYEVVVAEAEVVASREITVLDWVLIRVLDELGGESPPLAVLADELGLQDPVFLREALQNLVDTGAVEFRKPESSLELASLRPTATGRQMLSDARSAEFCERHGLRLMFDALTGDHVLKLAGKTQREPARPIVPAHWLPGRIAHLGLERVRECSRRQDESFCRSDAQIRGATVHREDGYHLWQQVRVSLGLAPGGTLAARVEGGTEAQQAWLARWDIDVFSRLGSVTTAGWANGRCHQRPPAMSASRS